MKILVPIKRVADANVNVRLQDDGSDVELKGTKMAINPFCEIALEEALRIKESRTGSTTEVIAVSIGDAQAQEQLRTAIALGADKAVHIESANSHPLEPLAIAKLLSKYVENENVDLVILGKQSIDGDNHQTGQMLAAILDLPQCVCASKVELNEGQLLVTCEADQGLQTYEITMPAIITADLRLNEPRFASMPAIMKAKRTPIETISINNFNVDCTAKTSRLKITVPPERAPGSILESIEELIEKSNLKEFLV